LDCVEGSGNNICVPGLFLIAVTVCLRITVSDYLFVILKLSLKSFLMS